MKRVRVIPCLLIKNGGLVKSVKFRDHKYVGDPINAVKIFNEKEVDEIIIIDISATAEKRPPDFAMIKELTSESFMPLGYGGGITKLDEIIELVKLGAEKVVLNSAALNNPTLIGEAAKYVGSQSIVVSLDVKKNFWGKFKVFSHNGTKNTGLDPVEYAIQMEKFGAGEILLNSIDKDGTFNGYDYEVIKKISESVNIPVVAIGGAASLSNMQQAIENGASAISAGSMFVFQRPHRAVLISYPSQVELKEELFKKL